MKLWKVIKGNDLNTLKVGDTVKVGDIETQITELQTCDVSQGVVIGFLTKDKISNNLAEPNFWGYYTSYEGVSLLLNPSRGEYYEQCV